MAMTSRERVLAAFNHSEPDRVPTWCGASAEFWEKAKAQLGLDDEPLRQRLGDDFRRVMATYAGPDFGLKHPQATYRTPFGVERHGYGYGMPISHPLESATTVEEVHVYPWPDPAWMDVSHIRPTIDTYDGQYAILGGEWCPFWHDAIDLFGHVRLNLLMFDKPEMVHAVLTHIVDHYLAVSRRIFEAAGDVMDVFFIGNDFGSQTGPLLGPPLFRQFMVPQLRRLVDLGHAFNLKVMMHCCGGYRPLIPDMIEAGLDGVHAVQPYCKGMDLAALKRDFGSRLLFNGCIDSHHVLIEGTPSSVRHSTREVLDIMKTGGGFVAGASHDTILEETPVENVVAMHDAIREFGSYRP